MDNFDMQTMGKWAAATGTPLPKSIAIWLMADEQRSPDDLLNAPTPDEQKRIEQGVEEFMANLKFSDHARERCGSETELEKHSAIFTYDGAVDAYYFMPEGTGQSTHSHTIEVADGAKGIMVLIDVAKDGTLRGIELIGMSQRLPPPPEKESGETDEPDKENG